MDSQNSRAGFTLLELFVLVAMTLIIAGVLIAALARPVHRKSPRIKCVNNLKNVGLAFRIFATDNDDRFPPALMLTNGTPISALDPLRVFLTLSNELSTPRILHCPEDKKRQRAESFANLTLKNLSYFVSLTTGETEPQAFLAGDRNLQTNGVNLQAGVIAVTSNTPLSWSQEIHNAQGNIAMGDGSVQQFNSARLRQAQIDEALQSPTNYLAFP